MHQCGNIIVVCRTIGVRLPLHKNITYTSINTMQTKSSKPHLKKRVQAIPALFSVQLMVA